MAIAFSVLPAPSEVATQGDASHESDGYAALRRAAREHPGEPGYLRSLGEASLRRGNADEAIGWLTQAVGLDRESASSQLDLGRALRAVGRREEAVAALREAVRVDPGHLEAWSVLGVVLIEAGDSREAAKVLGRLVARAPDRASSHSNLAVALFNDERPDEGLACFKRAVRVDPDSADLRRNLGLALAATGDQDGAVTAFRHAVRLRPAKALHHLDLADTLYAQGRRAEAALAYDEALSLDPPCLLKRPRSQEARQDLTLTALREEVRPHGKRPFLSGALLLLLRAGAGLARAAGHRKGLDLAVALLLVVPATFATVALLRPWVRHHRLHDEAVRIARLPVAGDRHVLAQLGEAVRKHGLERSFDRERCRVRSAASRRRIACDYVVSVELLPGLHRPLTFHLEVDEPFLLEEDPVFF